MTPNPNRPPVIPRQVATPQRYHRSRPERNNSWILWSLLGLALAVPLALIAWRLQYQEKMRETEKQVSALLASADQLIQKDRENEAEDVARKALGLLPGDVRCQAMLDRINTKREMIHKKMAADSDLALAQAEQLAISDVAGAIEALGRIRRDKSFTEEAQRTAAARAQALKSGACSLRLPKDWPPDAVLLIDSITKTPKKGIVDDIVHGKRTILVTRFGYRDSAAIELDFRGLEPLQLPAIEWKLRGAKVFVTSRPAGAAVWWNGKDTGKVTPCAIEDVDDGPIELLLKHPKYADTPAKGEVKNRQPLKLIATLEPPAAPSP